MELAKRNLKDYSEFLDELQKISDPRWDYYLRDLCNFYSQSNWSSYEPVIVNSYESMSLPCDSVKIKSILFRFLCRISFNLVTPERDIYQISELLLPLCRFPLSTTLQRDLKSFQYLTSRKDKTLHRLIGVQEFLTPNEKFHDVRQLIDKDPGF